jgi:hypothetical protein
VKRGKYGEAGMGASYVSSRVRRRSVNPTCPHRLGASRRSTSPAVRGEELRRRCVFKHRISFARTDVLRDASSSGPIAGRGRGMAPRGLGGCRWTATGRSKKRDHPASPATVFRQLSRGGVSPLGGPAAGGGRAGLFIPVPCGCNRLRYRLRSALSPRVGQTNPCIPQGYTARSHHPRAVEHRDCPPCGGGERVIAWGWMGVGVGEPGIHQRIVGMSL